MKIAIASLGDPESLQTWSGIPANITVALKRKGHEIFPITLRSPKQPWTYDWLRRYYSRTQRKWFMAAVEPKLLKCIGQQLDEQVNRAKPEVVLVIHGDWLAYSSFETPACIIHDTTFASISDYYPEFTNLAARSLRLGNQMYQRALDKAKASFFSADWAAKSAIEHYRIDASKIFTLPLGANIAHAPTRSQVDQWIRNRVESRGCNFLFLGKPWLRKGGPDALRFITALQNKGIECRLTIIGCSPEIPSAMADHVTVLGFLRKDVASDAERLTRALVESHALILLSQAECYGCVYCEANAYGLPALGRDTGGVPEIIKDGVNGLLMDSNESPESLAGRWAAFWLERSQYAALSQRAYTEYSTRLNLNTYADRLTSVLETLLQRD